jgi:hypothetical protein
MTEPTPGAATRGHDIAVVRRTLAAHDASAAQIADAMVATWYEVDAALAPIIGRKAVAALYKRSLYLTGRTHPWLAGAHDGAQAAIDLAALKSVVARQSNAEAALGSSELLQTFDQLLSSLIGPSLTERLLRGAWAGASSGPPTPDTTR